MLAKYSSLESSQISDVEATQLHLWLSDQVSERLQNQVISAAIGQESLSEQIKICTMLLEGASAIAEQFTFLNQLSPLDTALSQAFRSNQQEVMTSSAPSSSAPEEWPDFRERLARDSAVLTQAAAQVLSNLKSTQIKKDDPTRDGEICSLSNLITLVANSVIDSGKARCACHRYLEYLLSR